jgi:hypothetical protein
MFEWPIGGLSEVDAQRLLTSPYVSALLKSAEAGEVNALRGHLSNPGGADGPSPDLHSFRTLLYTVSRKRKDTVTHQERLHRACGSTSTSSCWHHHLRATTARLGVRRTQTGCSNIYGDCLRRCGIIRAGDHGRSMHQAVRRVIKYIFEYCTSDSRAQQHVEKNTRRIHS